MPTQEEIAELEAAALLRLHSIEKVIINREKCREKDINYTMRVPFVKLLSPIKIIFQEMEYNLYSDSKCTGCGSCEKVCLSKR